MTPHRIPVRHPSRLIGIESDIRRNEVMIDQIPSLRSLGAEKVGVSSDQLPLALDASQPDEGHDIDVARSTSSVRLDILDEAAVDPLESIGESGRPKRFPQLSEPSQDTSPLPCVTKASTKLKNRRPVGRSIRGYWLLSGTDRRQNAMDIPFRNVRLMHDHSLALVPLMGDSAHWTLPTRRSMGSKARLLSQTRDTAGASRPAH